MPLPASTPLTSTSTSTLVPALQYVLGRQWASVSLSQYQEPVWAGVEVTFMCFSNSARSVTGRSKVTIDRHADADGLARERGHRRVGLLVEA